MPVLQDSTSETGSGNKVGMGFFRNAWSATSGYFTLQSLLGVLFPTGALVGLAVWLSTLTTIVKLFAPLSYLIAALFAALLSLMITNSILVFAKLLGWRPPSSGKIPRQQRDAKLKEVLRYVVSESAFGQGAFGIGPAKDALTVFERELMDGIRGEEMCVWGRYGHTGVKRLTGIDGACLNIARGTLTVVNDFGSVDYTDLQFNWKEVRRVWPRRPVWNRIGALWKIRKPL